jgi:hypothetical protein
MMQTHLCVVCKQDSIGGGSKVFGGMFFKMCRECYEDEKSVQLLNDYLLQIDREDEECDG